MADVFQEQQLLQAAHDAFRNKRFARGAEVIDYINEIDISAGQNFTKDWVQLAVAAATFYAAIATNINTGGIAGVIADGIFTTTTGDLALKLATGAKLLMHQEVTVTDDLRALAEQFIYISHAVCDQGQKQVQAAVEAAVPTSREARALTQDGLNGKYWQPSELKKIASQLDGTYWTATGGFRHRQRSRRQRSRRQRSRRQRSHRQRSRRQRSRRQ